MTPAETMNELRSVTMALQRKTEAKSELLDHGILSLPSFITIQNRRKLPPYSRLRL